MNKQLISAALAVAFSIAGYAQSGTNSPYSQFGLGLLSDQSHGFNSGMNGVGMGYRSGDVVNTLNPASYSAIDSLTMVFDVGVTGQITSFKEGDTRLNAKNAEASLDEFISIHPVAIECCIGKYDENVGRLLRKIRDAGIRIWLNSIWASLCDSHDDDRAVELGEPDESWGWMLEQGGTIIQSDRPFDLLQYLKKHRRHKLK